MPVTEDRPRFENRNRHSHLNKNRDGRRKCNRNNGMHRDAQRAVVCIGFQRMDVRDLHHGQQREKYQTYQGSHHERSLGRLGPVPFCARCQQHHPLT